MRWVLAAILALHGLLHLMGTLKGSGLAALPQLSQPISRPMAVAWTAAAVLMIAAAAGIRAWPRGWWMIAAVAIAVSQIAIASSWSDAWAGTIVNVVLLPFVVHAALTEGPTSFRARMDADAARALARAPSAPIVTERDLAHLPDPVRRYVRASGAVGQPRVRSVRLRFRGRIRGAAGDPWMPFVADQVSTFDDVPTRLFLMRATRSGVPVEAFHRYVDGRATMQVVLAGIVPLVDARGDDMDRSETVTFFNDVCILAPSALIDRAIEWEPIDDRHARARFRSATATITATLAFDDAGMLVDFVSDDRSRASPDGRTFTRLRFSTPVRDPRPFGAHVLAAHGEARWHLPEGELVYGEFDLVELETNVAPLATRATASPPADRAHRPHGAA